MKNILLRFIKIDPYFYEHYKEKIQVEKSGCEYILFRIAVYFTEYLLAVEIDEKGLLIETSLLRKKGNLLELMKVKKAMMQTMKQGQYKRLSVNLKT